MSASIWYNEVFPWIFTSVIKSTQHPWAHWSLNTFGVSPLKNSSSETIMTQLHRPVWILLDVKRLEGEKTQWKPGQRGEGWKYEWHRGECSPDQQGLEVPPSLVERSRSTGLAQDGCPVWELRPLGDGDKVLGRWSCDVSKWIPQMTDTVSLSSQPQCLWWGKERSSEDAQAVGTKTATTVSLRPSWRLTRCLFINVILKRLQIKV